MSKNPNPENSKNQKLSSPTESEKAEKQPAIGAPSVNYHLTKYCNMKCNFCYATFHDLGTVKHDYEKSLAIVTAIAEAGFQKITFAGGEPTLVKELPELAKHAKECGLVTTIVTNGSGLADQSYYDRLISHLDWVAISIDSTNDELNIKSGRALAGNRPLSVNFYTDLHKKLRASGVKTKINTVVSATNHEEDMSGFINSCEPDRWKILQALPVEGQNSEHTGTFEVTDAQFKAFLQRNSNVSSNTALVAEEIELIKGSYIMISPEGKFYDNTTQGYTYSEEILKVGIHEALKQVNFDLDKFNLRGGNYKF
jgi:radical S-adenosyl methionine domain-containing protein 2